VRFPAACAAGCILSPLRGLPLGWLRWILWLGRRLPEREKAPAGAGAGIETPKLEGELGCELDTARAAASEERVADAHVSGGRQVVAAHSDFAVSG
jgi:hypothetical protein